MDTCAQKSTPKQRQNCVWDINASQEEILLKSTSSSLKRKKARNDFIISPSVSCRVRKEETFISSSPLLNRNITRKENVGLFSSPVLPAFRKNLLESPDSPRRHDAETLKIGNRSELLGPFSSPATNFVNSDKNPFQTKSDLLKSLHAFQTKLNSADRPKLQKTSKNTIEKISHKDEAAKTVVLEVETSLFTDTKSFFSLFLKSPLKEAGIAYRETTDPQGSHTATLWQQDENDTRKTKIVAKFMFVTPSELKSKKLFEDYFLVIYSPLEKPKTNSVIFPEKQDFSLQDHILKIQMQRLVKHVIYMGSNNAALGVMITELIRAIAYSPFRKNEKTIITIPGKKAKAKQDALKKMLMLINGVSEPIADAIVAEYQSLGTIIRKFKEEEIKHGTTQASFLLSLIPIQRQKKTRSLGPALSQRIFTALLERDHNFLLEKYKI